MQIWKRLFPFKHRTDISERRQAEEELRAREKRFRALIENSSGGIALTEVDGTVRFHADILKNVRDGVIVTDLKTKIVYWNEGATSVYGYSAEEMLGRTPRILYPSEESYQQYLKKLIEQSSNTGVEERIRKDGRRVWVDLKVAPMLDATGQVIGFIGVAKDITERRQVEQALRDSEKKFRTVAESTPASVIIYQGTKFRYANPATEKITGYSREELSSMNFWQFFHPDLREAAKQRGLARRRSESVPSQYETKIITKSGEERLFYISAATLMDFEGKPAVLAIGLDITEHKRAEEKLRQSEEEYRLLFENNPHPMWVYDCETLAFLAVNDAAVQHYGYSREEFLAMTIKEIRPEAEVQRLLDALPNPALRSGGWKHRKKDGTGIDVEINVHGLSFSGKSARLVLANDVTERKQAEERLRESEERFRAMCNASPVGIFLTEPDGRCIYDNAAHMRMSGLTGGEAMDFGWVKSIHPEDRERSVNGWRAAVESNTPYVGVNRYLHDDGTVIWADVRTAPVCDGKKVLGYVGVVQDITERTRALEELRISRQSLRSLAARLHGLLEEQRTRIAREIHDELGQFLTGLKMDLVWVGGRLSKSQSSLKEKTVSMACLIDRLVESVRRISTELRPGILDDLGLEAAIEWQAHEFQERTGIRTQFTSALGDAHLDRGLSTAAFRILQEALTNVARHANATKVTIDLRELDGELALMVEDTGVGIKSSEIADKQSLGILGMRERAHLFGGEVEIHGQKGRGTTVALRIPLNQSVWTATYHDQSADRG